MFPVHLKAIRNGFIQDYAKHSSLPKYLCVEDAQHIISEWNPFFKGNASDLAKQSSLKAKGAVCANVHSVSWKFIAIVLHSSYARQ